VIAVDTNILVYAYRKESPFHAIAFEKVRMLAESGASWAIPWPCVHEFISITTNPKVFSTNNSLEESFNQIRVWRSSETLQLLAETDEHFGQLQELLLSAKARGGQIHDARIAAICMQHGVSELWTADRDFSRYPKLRTRNPLVGVG
jgi:uncharacterized protein